MKQWWNGWRVMIMMRMCGVLKDCLSFFGLEGMVGRPEELKR